MEIFNIKSRAAANRIAGTLGKPEKMPGSSFGIPAQRCQTGAKLHKVPGSVCASCYALNGNYLYPSVQTAMERRFERLNDPQWIEALTFLILEAQRTGKIRNLPIVKGYHRWHDSGDIQSVQHLENIAQVARNTPKVKHWLPTRELKIVLAWEAAGYVRPSNLVIRVSATMIDGEATKAWPHVSYVHSDDKLVKEGAFRCVAPDHDGHCGPCRKCWSDKVHATSYHHH